MYQINLDKSDIFKATIKIEGATDASPRLILETDSGINLVCYGNIINNEVQIKLPKLKRILEENSTGKIKLEVIADDCIIIPWQDQYSAKNSKKVVVEVLNSEHQPKISATVKLVDSDFIKFSKELSIKLKENNINMLNYKKNINKIKSIVNSINGHDFIPTDRLPELILNELKK